DQPDAIVEQLRPRLAELLAAGPARLGVGTAHRDGDEDVTVVALQGSGVRTRPIPRALPDGGVARIEGEVLPPYGSPEVFITHEDGSVSRAGATVGAAGTKFRAELDCGKVTGKEQVEITAVDSSGSTVLANFPVWCRADAPTEITVAPSTDDSSPVATEAEAEARMLDLVNRDRAAAGLPALTWDERVAEVARGHSREMQQTGAVAHVSATTGTAADRVKAAGIRSAAVLENIARAYGVAEAEDGLMNSPGHRANLMSPAVTHVGIGVIFGEQVAGRREMFITQVFTRVTPPIDPAAVASDLRAAIDKVRTLSQDEALDKVAVAYAQELAAGHDAKQASARASRSLEALAPRYRRIGSVVTTVSDLAALDPESLVSDGLATHLGIGIAQGTHEELGEGAIFVVLLLAFGR
ncbi:MAG: CAP domain-containing protein, partial [Myxococcales bacterium]|nr:CAP domain-containing protein [Myxococcales bacterium]